MQSCILNSTDWCDETKCIWYSSIYYHKVIVFFALLKLNFHLQVFDVLIFFDEPTPTYSSYATREKDAAFYVQPRVQRCIIYYFDVFIGLFVGERK